MTHSAALSLLIVDDDAAIRKIFSEVIASRESVEVHEAANAEEALQILRLRTFDITFVDVMMPRIGGMDLLERIKKERPGVEVVMVTAYATIESAVQAMKLGASDYLPKPFKLDQVSVILRRVRRVGRFSPKTSCSARSCRSGTTPRISSASRRSWSAATN